MLWEVNLGAAVTGYPITLAVGGQQYVAVSTGGSLATGGLTLTPELRPARATRCSSSRCRHGSKSRKEPGVSPLGQPWPLRDRP